MVAERVTPSMDPKNRTRHFPDGSEAVHGTSRTGQKPYMAGHKPYTYSLLMIIKPRLAFIIINNGESRKLV